MTTIKKNLLKSGTLITLLVIVLCSIAYSSLSGNKWFSQGDKTSIQDTVANPITLRDSVVSFSMGLLGKPYVEGGCSKNGFDCSGFVYFVFQHFKIQVPRSSSQFEHFGKEIPIERVKKGDILLFLSPTSNVIGLVGIVTNPKGKESDFSHSTSGREMKVVITSLKKEGYARRFVKAVRVF